MFPTGGVIEYSYIRINHFIISYEKKTWIIDGPFCVIEYLWSFSWERGEVFLNKFNQLIVIYISSSHDNHVLSKVVGCMEINNHVSSNLVYVINIT